MPTLRRASIHDSDAPCSCVGQAGGRNRFQFLAVTALLMPLSAGGLKLASPCPVLFRQCRWALKGQSIPAHRYEFRAITVGEDGHCFHQATKCHPPATRFAAFSCKTGKE